MKKGPRLSFNTSGSPIVFNLWPPSTTPLHPTSIPFLFGRNTAVTRRMNSSASYAPVEYLPLEDTEGPERYRPG
jgi:hypothetical protein